MKKSDSIKQEKTIEMENQFQYPLQINILCENADIQGQVKFGKCCVVNPGCQIIAENDCEIQFGDYNIVDEKCSIFMKYQKDKQQNIMQIGSYNIFEIGSKIDSSNIGNMNIFEIKSAVESNCEIKNGNIIGTTVRLPQKTKIENNMRIYYPDKMQKEQQFDEEQHKKNVVSLYETLAQLIPKGNPIKQNKK